jgi:hypothetical protein
MAFILIQIYNKFIRSYIFDDTINPVKKTLKIIENDIENDIEHNIIYDNDFQSEIENSGPPLSTGFG